MKKPKSRENVLTPEERERLLKAIRYEDEELAIKGLLFTGMRVSEFIHFKRDWINLDEGIIHIPYKMKCKCYECMSKRSHKGWFVVKTKHAERPIPILPEVEDLFMKYFEEYNSVMDMLYHRVNVWKLVKRVGLRAKIHHKVFPHSLRATFATMVVEKGLEDAIALKDLMGWKKIDMAIEYIRLSGTGLKRKIEEIWQGS
ncbi:MAG: tyrosine-type recombinase/integrase [Candidatus Heimdallarchaeaceae archaeon]